jgi:hypothetical protein|tara:strand:+ start:253 stop:468 length:216 start_codon:yes stop_codon:yes gene_type:complete
MSNIETTYEIQQAQEKFAALVAARVNDIKSGTAQDLIIETGGGAPNTPAEQALLFADLIARAVCHFSAEEI